MTDGDGESTTASVSGDPSPLPLEEEDDDLLGDWDDADQLSFCESFSWWDKVSLSEVLKVESPTTVYVPEGVEHAVATFKGAICEYIDECKESNNVPGEINGWKALIASDALLFFDVKGTEVLSRKGLVAERIKTLENGHWGVLWAHVESAILTTGDADTTEDLKCAGRVKKLMEANELSKAAAAIWGAGDRVPIDDVKKKNYRDPAQSERGDSRYGNPDARR